ncbi:Pimeloyl-ACP methyl ester carboxylesterase [Flavobacterium aquidurense]|uniref:Alpha/beta hydrolase n=1 Tax=Flavobacterium frigidimaris TaxID=262320 RepID=A0ABX4BLH7_FLAFR|nr:alpha/beta hydrolase [Flavobacterium frigidimaris]OXA77030.1 alpha/beta hydrolase [Flavobacterium frigidimaris]SDZ25377.1 Pimeloyl-ACP methyl ester carboxylesterase [Flavobacterium aquidurense]
MYLSNTKTIVFITGAFVSHSCWEKWIVFFENQGYKTVAPPWPYKNESVETLRNQHPDSKIALLRLSVVLDYYVEIIEKLPEKPILIGHSYGGLLTQLLVQKELAFAGICIHSVAPKGMFTAKFSFYKAIWKPLGFFTSAKKTYLMTFKEWQTAFTNEMSFEEQNYSYEKLVIPESKSALRDILTKTARINFKKKHEPLLFLSGSNDTFILTSLNYSNFKRYTNIHSITCYKEFKGRNHFVIEQSDWPEVAAFIARWLEKIS